MLRLNILSEESKKEIKLITIYKAIKRLSFFVFSLLLIYTVTFQASKMILKKYSTDSYNNNLATNKDSEEYVTKVKEVNEQIIEARDIQNNFVYWSNVLNNLSQIAKEGISFSQVTVDKKSNSFIIMGKADTRDKLLDFKSDLENLSYVETVDLPINNLLKKDDISFTINAKFLNYEF